MWILELHRDYIIILPKEAILWEILVVEVIQALVHAGVTRKWKMD
jgi:hypothetical protein